MAEIKIEVIFAAGVPLAKALWLIEKTGGKTIGSAREPRLPGVLEEAIFIVKINSTIEEARKRFRKPGVTCVREDTLKTT